MNCDGQEHFDRLLGWLDLESIAETRRLAERRKRRADSDVERTGESLLDLAIEDHQSGLGGRFLLTLVKRNRTLELPWNRLKVGSPVVLSQGTLSQAAESSEPLSAVVSGRSNRSIQVAVDHWPDGDVFRLDLAADEVTRRRQRAAILAVREAWGRVGELRRVLLGEAAPRFSDLIVDSEAELTSVALNPSQQSAIQFALSAEDVAVIHGPPGTGKTTTIVEFIRRVVDREEKVLACAPSNTAVDNVLERLVAAGVRCVRLGHPARVAGSLHDHTLDALVAAHENTKWVKSLMREVEELYRDASRYTRARPARGARRELRDQAKRLKADARQLERQAIEHILDSADVICATTTLDESLLGDRQFEWAVIDEACQSTEPGCWIPVRRANRLVLAGDHCQLPPTVISQEAAAQGFGVSLMERLVGDLGENVSRRLTTQYRMHEKIMQFSSEQFYESSLTADESVAQHVLSDILPPFRNLQSSDSELSNALSFLDEPALFIDTAGADFDEELEPDGLSKRNPREAALVLKKVAQLEQAGLAPSDIAVIAPYAAQVRLIRQARTSDELEVDTVDGFQGREKEAVIITLVRSNRTGEIGFLADSRRMNVALTRARRKLIVIGDSATLGGHVFYSRMLEYFERLRAYRSVWEEPDWD